MRIPVKLCVSDTSAHCNGALYVIYVPLERIQYMHVVLCCTFFCALRSDQYIFLLALMLNINISIAVSVKLVVANVIATFKMIQKPPKLQQKT